MAYCSDMYLAEKTAYVQDLMSAHDECRQQIRANVTTSTNDKNPSHNLSSPLLYSIRIDHFSVNVRRRGGVIGIKFAALCPRVHDYREVGMAPYFFAAASLVA